ncbi:protein FAM227A [Acomys russatus]|uniref:protein FAM227A n=1 Tax=Acomys russatus TaxID=60746 RepID=UPI0021E25F91|nr:protein FAM227A [Acomys russatus]
MESAKRLDVINITALPIVVLAEQPVVSRRGPENTLQKQLTKHLPTCIIGSMSQVNRKITEIDLGLLDSTLAIETYESEKTSLKEKTRGSPGDRAKKLKEEPPISCKGSELRKARVALAKRKTADKNLLAELHQHPPFDETKPNRLPNGIEFCDMVGNVIRSEKNTLSGKSFCSDRELEKFLTAPFPSAIWLDSFWWIFHDRYQPNKEIQNKLFDRIAQNYARLLFTRVWSHYEEALIKRLPSLLSKGLYTSFCCCFPQSWFNTHEFKSEICNTMDLWISGTYPCPQSYNNWDYSELDPERFRREEMMLQSSRLIRGKYFSLFTCKKASIQKAEQKSKRLRNLPPLGLRATLERGVLAKQTPEERSRCHHAMKDYFMPTLFSRRATHRVKRISEVRACYSTFLKTSHPACKSPSLTANQFNLYGKSPLIVYFFLNYSKLQQHGQDVLISRRERTKLIPDSAVTYADIIQLVTKNIEKRKRKLRQLGQLHEDEWTYFNKYLMDLKENFDRKIKIINKRAEERRKDNQAFLSSSLLFDDLCDKKSKGNPSKETAFLSRKEKKQIEEKRKFLSPVSFQSPAENYSLGLKSPYSIGSVSSISEHNSSKSKSPQEMLFRLSPSSME